MIKKIKISIFYETNGDIAITIYFFIDKNFRSL